MADAAEISRQKRRSNVAVLAGLALMVLALLASSVGIGPRLLTTAGGIAGFGLVMYGVHVGWLVFYEREPDGPPS